MSSDKETAPGSHLHNSSTIKQSSNTTQETIINDEKISHKTSLDRTSSHRDSSSGKDEIVPNQAVPEPEVDDLEKNEKPTGPVAGGINPADFPDGGLEAWLVVFGGFCCLFCKF